MTSSYVMSKKMAKLILSTKEKKKSDQQCLCDYVNNEIHPLYPCTQVFCTL